jgi:hypothetical protein
VGDDLSSASSTLVGDDGLEGRATETNAQATTAECASHAKPLAARCAVLWYLRYLSTLVRYLCPQSVQPELEPRLFPVIG